MSPDICFPFISEEVLHKNCIQIFLLSKEYCPLIRCAGNIQRVKDILEILGTGSGNKLKVPSSPMPLVIQRLELSRITANGLPVLSD